MKVGQLRRYEVGVSTSDGRKRREHASKINPRELRINPQLQQVASEPVTNVMKERMDFSRSGSGRAVNQGQINNLTWVSTRTNIEK